MPWDHHGRPRSPLILLNSVHGGSPIDSLSADSYIGVRSLLKASHAEDSFIPEIGQSRVPPPRELLSFDLGHLFKEGTAQVLVPAPEVGRLTICEFLHSLLPLQCDDIAEVVIDFFNGILRVHFLAIAVFELSEGVVFCDLESDLHPTDRYLIQELIEQLEGKLFVSG